jgi:hypothetical protein
MLHVLYKYVEQRHGILPFYRTTNNMLMPFRVGEKKLMSFPAMVQISCPVKLAENSILNLICLFQV